MVSGDCFTFALDADGAGFWSAGNSLREVWSAITLKARDRVGYGDVSCSDFDPEPS